MPVLYKIDDNDSDKVLKDKLRKILDNLSHQISTSDGSIQSIQSTVNNITSSVSSIESAPAEKIRVANSAPLNPDEGDVYVNTIEDAFYVAVG